MPRVSLIAPCGSRPLFLKPLKNTKFSLLLLALSGACSPDKPAERAVYTKASDPPPAVSTFPRNKTDDTLTTYAWETESCRFTGRYNPRRYSKEQLDNVQKLLFGSASLQADAMVYRLSDVQKLSLDTLTVEYTRRIALYRAMQVVPQPTWLMLKKQAIREMEEDYQAKKITIQAFADPAILLTVSHPSGCSRYVQGLAAHNDSLTLRDWKNYVDEQVKREKKLSGGPESYSQRYNEEYNTAERLLYAKVELLTFGWWNCVNQSIHRVEPTEKTYRQFQQLFVGVKSECDDVD